MRKLVKSVLSAAVCAALILASGIASAQTAQSVMVDTSAIQGFYEITGTVTWTYDRDTAETYYTNTLTSGPVTTAGSGTIQTSPGAPAPDGN